jgi:hypothetical protein
MLMQELARAVRPAAVLAAVENAEVAEAEAPPMEIKVFKLG